MKHGTRGALIGGAVGAMVTAAVAAGVPPVNADGSFTVGNQPTANPRSGVQDNVLASGLDETSVAWGQLPLANPDAAAGIGHYGENTTNGGPLTQDAHEAYKTEPDKNVYLVFNGKHYLYQGHEGGPRGYVTRIDLDQADPAQRVTLIADQDPDSNPVPTFDGITWDPFSHQLLLTAEAKAPTGGVFGVTLDSNGDPTTGRIVRLAALGSGGYEGVQNDAAGNVWLVEDVGGTAGGTAVDGKPRGKVPNSYVYRFTPTDRTQPSNGGTLQALRVYRSDGGPATAAELQADGRDPFITDLHTYGRTFTTDWVTVDPTDSTAGAEAAGATPFKRPENGVFRPGTDFREFYFTETGDTDTRSDLPGGYGGVFRVTQASPNAPSGTIAAVYLGDEQHTGLDNIAFATADQLLVVEDAGDTLHGQRNALDSGYALDLHGNRARTPDRWLAEGRDASATYDALFWPGYNDGDNEITGIHVSNGDPTPGGLLGTVVPRPFTLGWRVFWTQQHGDNVTWEVTPAAGRH